jgi:hypothetical protein
MLRRIFAVNDLLCRFFKKRAFLPLLKLLVIIYSLFAQKSRFSVLQPPYFFEETIPHRQKNVYPGSGKGDRRYK